MNGVSVRTYFADVAPGRSGWGGTHLLPWTGSSAAPMNLLEDIKCLPTEHEEPPLHGMRLKRRSRRQPRSPQNSLRSVQLSRMPRSLSPCELTGTFLITFKKPDRAGKTGSMRRCERQLGSKSARWERDGRRNPMQARVFDMAFTQPVVHELERVRSPTTLMIGQLDRTALAANRASPEVAEARKLPGTRA
jgi:hypothetical protein